MESLAEKVKRLRDEEDWSQAELARRSRIMPATISRIESGEIMNPGIENLKALAKAFGISVGYLIGVKDPKSLDNALINDPDAQVIFRGYERLPSDKREQLKRFVKFLQEDEQEE